MTTTDQQIEKIEQQVYERVKQTLNDFEYCFKDVKKDLADIRTMQIEHTDIMRRTRERVYRLENWRYATIGGLSVVIVIVVPILLHIINKGV